MRQTPQNNDFSIGKTYADVMQKSLVWCAVLVFPTLAYLRAALYFVQEYSPAVHILGFTQGYAETLLLDLIIVAAPMCIVLAIYLRRIRQGQSKKREMFVAAFHEEDLVRSMNNRNDVYHVIARGEDGEIRQMQVVWTPNGPCDEGRIYEGVDPHAVVPFISAEFLTFSN